MPTTEEDLQLIAEQERLLQFASFSAENAWILGNALRAEAVSTQSRDDV